MTVCSDIADYKWLTGDEARAMLNDLASDDAPLHTTVSRLRRQFSPERTHLLIEQVRLRRQAAAKFTAAAQMFFTSVGLQQATDQWIAAYKATRFARRFDASTTPVIADLCCGIGGDLISLQSQADAFGLDRDPCVAQCAYANSNGAVGIGEVCEIDIRDVAAWHIDPDRRPSGARTTSVHYCEPDLAAMDQMLARVPHAAVKLAPAAEVPDHWASRCELEWISRDRECRQLVAWHGALASSPGERRATIVLRNFPPHVRQSLESGIPPVRTIVGQPNRRIPIGRVVDRYVFDIDPAVRAAALNGCLAAEHDLAALGTGPSYLIGPRPINDPALVCFEVLDTLPMQVRRLAPYLRERAIGQLEIKKRGVDLDPEKLRRELKLRGDSAATLLITCVAGHPTAILTRRIR